MAEGLLGLKKQISFALRQAEPGAALAEICRRMGGAEPTYRRWIETRSVTRKSSAMGASEIPRPEQLEEDPRRLKLLVADLPLGKLMLRGRSQ